MYKSNGKPKFPKVKIDKVLVQAKTRQLKAEWTMELPQEIEHSFGPGVEQMLNQMLQERIDGQKDKQ